MKSLVVFFLAVMVYAQKAEVRVDVTGYVPVVKVTSPVFKGMCEGFAKKLEAEGDNITIRFKPETVSVGQDAKAGLIWTANTEMKESSLKLAELPKVLQTLKGSAARLILMGTCRTADTLFYTSSDVVFVTSSKEDAEELAKVLR
jgi:hypothetical protein